MSQPAAALHASAVEVTVPLADHSPCMLPYHHPSCLNVVVEAEDVHLCENHRHHPLLSLVGGNNLLPPWAEECFPPCLRPSHPLQQQRTETETKLLWEQSSQRDKDNHRSGVTVSVAVPGRGDLPPMHRSLWRGQ
jgi:hypothetical protein